MSDGNLSTDASKDIETPKANYTLKLTLGIVPYERVEIVEAVRNHSLRSGFLVVETAYGEYWFKASDVSKLHRYV